MGYGEGRAAGALNNKDYPRGSFFEAKQTGNGGTGDADWAAVGFVDYAGRDFRLSLTSQYRARGTDGKDLGVDVEALKKATE